jgi:hypothetical protein
MVVSEAAEHKRNTVALGKREPTLPVPVPVHYVRANCCAEKRRGSAASSVGRHRRHERNSGRLALQ